MGHIADIHKASKDLRSGGHNGAFTTINKRTNINHFLHKLESQDSDDICHHIINRMHKQILLRIPYKMRPCKSLDSSSFQNKYPITWVFTLPNAHNCKPFLKADSYGQLIKK